MMNKKYIKGIVLASLIASLGLPSCSVLKKYETPVVETENLYRDINPSDTTTIANIPWNEYFTDPLLQALIDEGLNNNFDMKVAAARIQQAEAALGMAKAAYFPSVALVGQVSHNRMSTNGQETKVLKYHAEQFTLGLGVSWELDLWGKMNRQSKSRYAQFLASHEYRYLTQTNIVAGIATSYYTLLSLDEQLRASKEAIELLQETVKTMEAMKEAGLLNAAGVEQTKSALYSTQVSIPDLESGIQELENSLCLLVGRKSGAISRSTFAAQTVPTEMKIGLPVQMLANRPDVRAAELTFRSAFEATNVAQANFYPSINLNTGSMVGLLGVSTLSNFFKPENIAASIIGGITQPLFAKKQLTTNLKVAKADQEIALINFEKAVLNASSEVSSILYTYESSLKKNELRNLQIESLNKSVEFTQLLLKAGEANYLEVIQAEQSLLQAQIGQINDKLQQLQSSVNLYKALGGGVK